jgi:hypothetical protein
MRKGKSCTKGTFEAFGRHLGYLNILTVWHVDPQADGSDDSCDWFGSHKTRENGWWPGDLDGWDDLPPETQRAIDYVWWKWRDKLGRPWWKHPKWHLHHWKLQWHQVQSFKRWAFSRCQRCGCRFKWGESVVGLSWSGNGPTWLKNGENVAHLRCEGMGVGSDAN